MKKDPKKLHAIALLGAVTGLSLIGSGGALAQEPRWPCEDTIPGHSSFDGARCAYQSFPLRPAVPTLTVPGPSPGPPYAS